MKMLYKYPQAAFPYADLWRPTGEGQARSRVRILDTGIFDEDRYFDVFVEYAKAGPRDILVKISAANRGPDPAHLHVLPTLWFRNTWSWSAGHETSGPPCTSRPRPRRPRQRHRRRAPGPGPLHPHLRRRAGPALHREQHQRRAPVQRAKSPPYVKDGINNYVVHGRTEAVNPANKGTKASSTLPAHNTSRRNSHRPPASHSVALDAYG